jgi:bacterioferritin (cytochrome b1)
VFFNYVLGGIMATLVGTQKKFIDAIKKLIELDYDAAEAYKIAYEKLENIDYKHQVKIFREDHERHIELLNKILVYHNENMVKGPDLKKWLTKGKVFLSNLIGDDIAILKAMHSNEIDTNTAYERINSYENKFQDAVKILEDGLADEKKHKQWLETIISTQ